MGGFEPLRLVRLLEADLPASAKPRKRRKPDFESLVVLPLSRGHPEGSLFALGSGSRPNRFKGALAALHTSGEVRALAKPINLEPLYAELTKIFDNLNIEGAFVAADALVLLQRGLERGTSAVIRFDLGQVMEWLEGHASSRLQPRSVRSVDLGEVGGVPFAFTDGAALPNGSWVFSAVAEARDDSYHDGPSLGCAIGICGSDDKLKILRRLKPARKVEGIEASVVGSMLHLHLVTDADDPSEAAQFGTAQMTL